MSTDLRDPSSTPPGQAPPERPKPALSITQVVGGALAAMTAAALGSRLSVAGTILGAALASVVAAVAGAVYTSSLRRTSTHVSAVWRTRVRPDGHGGTTTVVEEVTPDGTTVQPPVPAAPTWAEATTGAAGSEATGDPATGAGTARTGEQGPRRRPGWTAVVVTAVLIFVVAAVALTGLELATGRALSGGTGTTAGQVAERRAATPPAPSPTTSRTPSATPVATAPAQPGATVQPTPSSRPTAGPIPTVSAGPSSSASPQPSLTPSSPVAPGAPAGSAASATP